MRQNLHPKSKYWDNSIYWYRDNKKLFKLCLGCGKKDGSITGVAVKSCGWCIDCEEKLSKMKYFESDSDSQDIIYDKFIKKAKNPFFNDFKNYK
jgi:hypothetical protein